MATKYIDLDTVHALKEALGSLIDKDTEIILMEGDKPVAKVVSLAKPSRKSLTGAFEGKIMMHDDFDDPLPDEFWFGKEE
jgi:antitoxin (DNA-binding transcriptional repressor) of toxin-antitoxin stability system